MIEYTGFIFFGLIKVKDDPYVIEYNCRLGDPETESVIPRIQNDLVRLFQSVAEQSLGNETITVDPRFAATVMLVSEGYPGDYQKGKVIGENAPSGGCLFFHAGTTLNPVTGETISSGGRVIAVTSYGDTMKEALSRSYENAEKISYDGKYFRKDIGFDLGS